MIDIFHISRICCKGTHYLRHYRKCASFFISRGWFLRRRGCFNTDFHGWGCEIYDGFPRICGGWGLTQISTDGVVRFMTDFHGFAAAGVSLTDFADFFAAVGVHGFLRNLSCLLIFVLICAIMCYLCLLLSWPWCGIFGGIVEIFYFCTSKANKRWKKVSEMSE